MMHAVSRAVEWPLEPWQFVIPVARFQPITDQPFYDCKWSIALPCRNTLFFVEECNRFRLCHLRVDSPSDVNDQSI